MFRSMLIATMLLAAAPALAQDLNSEALARCGGVQKCVDGVNDGTLKPETLIACFAAINRPSSPDWEAQNEACANGLREFVEANRRGHKPRR